MTMQLFPASTSFHSPSDFSTPVALNTRHANVLPLIRETGRVLAQTTSLMALANRASQLLQQMMNVDWACLLLPNANQLVLGLAGQVKLSWLSYLSLEPTRSLLQYLQQQARPITKMELLDRFQSKSLSIEELNLLLCEQIRLLVPIHGYNNTLGLLVLGAKSDQSGFSTRELEFLHILGDQIGMGFQKAQFAIALKQAAIEGKVYKKRVISAREEERKHISRELHDEVIQSLTLIKHKLSRVQKTVESKKKRQISQLKEEVGQLIQNTRRMCQNLRPAVLDLGVVASIRSLIRTTQQEGGFKINLRIKGDREKQLNQPIIHGLFRFTQEALQNIRKHAKAQTIDVTLQIGADEIYLAIKDDGCGFVPPSCLKQLAARQHFGLVGLHERVQSLHGRFNITSQVGKGTQVEAYVPINNVTH